MLSTLLIPLLQGTQGLGQTTLETVMTLDLRDYILRPVVAIAVGLALAIVYRSTHKGLSYSQSFLQTLVFVSLVVALVMMTVRNSLATAFTLVGAMSIIRFRTVVKDTRTAFVFACRARRQPVSVTGSRRSHRRGLPVGPAALRDELRRALQTVILRFTYAQDTATSTSTRSTTASARTCCTNRRATAQPASDLRHPLPRKHRRTTDDRAQQDH
jgi:hypothetical protein